MFCGLDHKKLDVCICVFCRRVDLKTRVSLTLVTKELSNSISVRSWSRHYSATAPPYILLEHVGLSMNARLSGILGSPILEGWNKILTAVAPSTNLDEIMSSIALPTEPFCSRPFESGFQACRPPQSLVSPWPLRHLRGPDHLFRRSQTCQRASPGQ